MKQPVDPHDPNVVAARAQRTAPFVWPRRRWPGLLAVGVLAALLTAFAVSSIYDRRSVGEKVDATVAATKEKMQDGVDELRSGASAAARDSAQAGERVAGVFSDSAITAAVKTSLATDPSLRALQIEVETEDGVVSLIGPAPDERSRERATTLAAAPDGVQRVDNRLVVSPPAQQSLSR